MEVLAKMPVQSVDRAVAILDALRARGDYLGVTELSNELGLHKSTVHRLLVSLRRGGFVERDPRTRRYRLGIRLVELGYAVLNSRGLPQIALPYLHYLADSIQEVCYLAIRDGDRILNVLQVPAPHMVQSVSWMGAGSLHATSTGKVFLAHMEDDAKEPYLQRGLAAYTDNTITEASKLRSELESVRDRGYATSWEEETEGVNAVAVPLRKPDGAIVAAIGLAGPSFRFTQQKALEVPEMMIGVAREIGKKLDPKPSKAFA
jgi:IclR family acetate operon transcriptional repressor